MPGPATVSFIRDVPVDRKGYSRPPSTRHGPAPGVWRPAQQVNHPVMGDVAMFVTFNRIRPTRYHEGSFPRTCESVDWPRFLDPDLA